MSATFLSLLYYIFTAIGGGLTTLVDRLKLERAWLINGFNIAFILVFASSWKFVVIALVYGLCVGMAGRILATTVLVRRGKVYTLALAAVVALLLMVKYALPLPILGQTLIASLGITEWIGLSYMTFKSVIFLSYCKNTPNADLRWREIIAFLLFFPSLVAGPVGRYVPFKDDLRSPVEQRPRFGIDDLIRMCVGVIKIQILANLALYWGPEAMMTAGQNDTLSGIIALNAHIAYFYLDFSGYCDIAITSAKLVGIRVPENFNYPFMARNIREFWTRWHISVTNCFRDFIFFPLMSFFTKLGWRPYPIFCQSLALFVTFFLMGIWHGDTLQWLFYGLYHGIGISLHQVADGLIGRHRPVLRKRLADSLVWRILGIATTIEFVAFGMYFTLPANLQLWVEGAILR